LKEFRIFTSFCDPGWNWAGRSIWSNSVGNWIFDMKFLPFFLKILQMMKINRFLLIWRKFQLLLHFCSPGMKLSWEIDFGQIPLETGFLTWNFFRFFLKFSKWWNKSFFAYLRKFQLFTSFLLSGMKLSWEIDFGQIPLETGFLTWNFFRFFLNSPNDEINRFLLIEGISTFYFIFAIRDEIELEIDLVKFRGNWILTWNFFRFS